jgi:hypothetical protein
MLRRRLDGIKVIFNGAPLAGEVSLQKDMEFPNTHTHANAHAHVKSKLVSPWFSCLVLTMLILTSSNRVAFDGVKFRTTTLRAAIANQCKQPHDHSGRHTRDTTFRAANLME